MARRQRRNIRVFRMNNMSGGINTKTEDSALIDVVPVGTANDFGPVEIPGEARDMENFNMLNRGGIQKTFGYEEFHDTERNSDAITGLTFYKRKGQSPVMVFSQGDKVYTLVSGTETDIGATITDGALVDFTTAKDLLIICDGTRVPQKYNGTTTSNLGGSPPSNARQSVYSQDRLWVFDTNESVIHHSAVDDIEADYASNIINCSQDDGQAITGISTFFIPNQVEQVIMVGKEKSAGIIVGDGTAANPFTFLKTKFDLGVPGFRQFVQFGQEIAFLTPIGVTTFSGSSQDVNLKEAFISSKVEDAFFNLSHSNRHKAISFLDWQRNRMGWAVTESDFSENNIIWYYDISQGGWYKTRPDIKITSAVVDDNGDIFTGTDDGKIYKWAPGIEGFDDGAIASFYQTPHISFFQPYTYKRILGARITVRGNGNFSMGVSTTLDFNRVGPSHTINMTGTKYTWGDGVWTDDPNVYQWGTSTVDIKEFIPSGWFKNIQFQLNRTGQNQLDIFNLEFVVEFGDRR